MGPGNQGRRSPAWLRALAGIEAGILGGVAMLAWPAVSSLVDLQSIWVVPNLLGSALSGHAVLHRGFGWVTVAGLGLHLFVAGSVGAGTISPDEAPGSDPGSEPGFRTVSSESDS